MLLIIIYLVPDTDSVINKCLLNEIISPKIVTKLICWVLTPYISLLLASVISVNDLMLGKSEQLLRRPNDHEKKLTKAWS